MKFQLRERFSSDKSLNYHHTKHGKLDNYYPKDNSASYLKKAEELANQPVDMFRIQGYRCHPDSSGRTKYVKWNRDTNDFVIYGREKEGSEPIIISMYKVNKGQFQHRLDTDARIAGEIPYGM